MKHLRLLLQLLWRFWFYMNGALVVIVFYPAYFILLQRKEWFPKVFKLYKICARLMLFNAGIFPKIIRKTKLLNGRPYVLCPNHCSYLDIVTTYIAIPEYFHFMGKAELKNIPLFGHFFKEMNIPVDRASIMSSHRAFQRAKEDIDKGISVAIFPEATIPETAPKLKVFKNGAFKLAIEKQVPVIPIVFLDNWKRMPDGILRRMFAGGPGISRMIIHDPVETTGMTENDLAALKNKVYKIIDETLSKKSFE
ncbi:MAG: lysophospholipid acyltransferase family protein [Bacteroidia bacterium]